MANDLSLHCCCNSVQLQVLIATCAYAVVFFLLWRTSVLFPLKLFTVALFELNRAMGCWISCGRVRGLSLFEGSQEQSTFVGGSWLVIQVFGYLGSIAWGLACIVASADYDGVQVMSALICAVLVLLLVFAKTWKVMACVALMLALMAAFWACTVLTVFNGLRFLVLAIGVISLFFPLYNTCLVQKRIATVDDVESVPGELIEISTMSKTGGFIWGLLSMSVAAAGIYLALVLGSNPNTK